jgi:hypothetical protein
MEQGQESKTAAAIETLKTEATEITREAKRASSQILEQRVDKFFNIFDDVERAVRVAATELENGQHPRLAQYVGRAADEVAHARGRFRGAEVGQLLSTAENLARTRPAAVLGAAFALGFVFVRLLKDTAPTERFRPGDTRYEGGYDAQTSYSGSSSRPYYESRPTAPGSYRQSATEGREDI